MGNRTLAEYTYSNDRNRQLLSLDYGNGDEVQYTYDEQGRVIQETYENGDTVTYTYDNAGGIATVTDSSSKVKSEVMYSAEDQLSRYTETGGDHDLLVRYKYDTMERISSILYMVDNVMGKAHNSTYTYDARNRLSSYRKGNGVLDYTYDKFERTTQTKLTHSDADILSTEYSFLAPTDGQTGNRVGTLKKTAADHEVTYTYTYDDLGNILTVSDGTNTTSYVYDSQNQLIRENNQAGNFTHTWEYDNAGNILFRYEYPYTAPETEPVNPTKTVPYVYLGNLENASNKEAISADNAWGDTLLSYNGQSIAYDELGNPNAIDGWEFTWEHGRELAGMQKGSDHWTFTYNADGLRTQRTNGSKTYDYVYYGDQLMYMQVDGKDFLFSYAPDGTPMGITYLGTAYYYLTNLQGDVVGILNNQGQRIVSYTYDAWGNVLSTNVHISSANYSAIAQYNPIRYRGYVYDTETGLYYLQSRYYNPEIGRFINADGAPSTGDGILEKNMYTYCWNCPVLLLDGSGYRPVVGASLEKETKAERAQSFGYMNKERDKKRAKIVVAETIYGDSGGRYNHDDWKDGMEGVASVIYNRKMASHFPDDYISVCTAPSQFSGYSRGRKAIIYGTYDEIMWDYAKELAEKMINDEFSIHPSLTSEYVYFHSAKYGNKDRIASIKQKKETVIMGGNMFYINYGK